MLRTACPICSEPGRALLRSIVLETPEGYPLANGFNVVTCASCGFAYSDTVASQDDYDRFYSKLSKYEDVEIGGGTGAHGRDAERAQDVCGQIQQIVTNPASRLLDIGCANGGLLGALKAAGFTNLLGVDPSPGCARNCTALHGVPAIEGSIFDAGLDIGKFDVVVMAQVLEHISQIGDVPPVLHSLLNPGGILYVEVPDARRYAELLLAPLQEFNTEHINHFTAEHLAYFFELNGFRRIAGGQRLTPLAAGDWGAAAFGFFTPASATAKSATPPSVEDELGDYIARSERWLSAIDDKLARDLEVVSSIAVWGAGQLLMKLLPLPSLRKIRLSAVIDRNRINHGQQYRGVKVSGPGALDGITDPIVIASAIQGAEIEAQMHDAGITNRIIRLAGKP